MKKALAILLTAVMLLGVLTACGSKKDDAADDTQNTEDADKAAADNVAALIDAIYVQERTDETDAQCEAAKAAWDALTDEQKSMVEGEEASPEYFGLDTGDASKDDPRNQDEIGENELLVVSFGTSYNDSRINDIKSIEDALQEAYPDWSVRRAFTAQIIINHIQARDGEKIDNMTQALDRAVANGVKNLVVQPTHLMHGAEYDEMCATIDEYRDRFESVSIESPCSARSAATRPSSTPTRKLSPRPSPPPRSRQAALTLSRLPRKLAPRSSSWATAPHTSPRSATAR